MNGARLLFVPMEVEVTETRTPGTITLHGFVGDYGVTLTLTVEDYEELCALTDNAVGTK